MSGALIHIVQILGVFVCAHHFWPKGITYGEQEEWEKAYRKKHRYSPRPKNPRERGDSNGSSRSGGSRRYEEKERGVREERAYEARYREQQRAKSAYDYEERPVYSRQASSRY
jgi:hypothetical protein